MTYGQIALILDGLYATPPVYTAQTVGWAMHALGDTDCWLRVINSKGGCSTGKVMLPANKQQLLLEQEGIEFDQKGHCDLSRYLWTPSNETRQQLIKRSQHEWANWPTCDFLSYITAHSKTPRHLFHQDMIRALYDLAGEEYKEDLFIRIDPATSNAPGDFIQLESRLADALVRAVRIRHQQGKDIS
jgi:alkylated DNA nucleotide flippase Atl1